MLIINYISRHEVAVYAFYSTFNSYQCPGRVQKSQTAHRAEWALLFTKYYLLHLVIVPSVLVHWQGGEAQL